MIKNKIEYKTYTVLDRIDLENNKKLFYSIQVCSFLIGVFMIGLGNRVVSFRNLFNSHFVLKVLCILVGTTVYVVLHETVHGLMMWWLGGKKAKIGFNKHFAFAYSDAIFEKNEYLVITLMPVAGLGLIIQWLISIVNVDCFWVFYYIQIVNVLGSLGDIYVFVYILNTHRAILVKDYGYYMELLEKKVSKT